MILLLTLGGDTIGGDLTGGIVGCITLGSCTVGASTLGTGAGVVFDCVVEGGVGTTGGNKGNDR